MKYIIGADGGGTKTTFAAFGAGGVLYGRSCSGAINYNFTGVAAAVENFIRGIEAFGLDGELEAIAIGDPSIDDTSENDGTGEFIKLLRQRMPRGKNTGDIPIYIKSDAFMALYGLTAGKEGVMIISGTGAMGIALDAFGKLHTAGGWGRLTGDEGSGYYIALSAIKAALRYYDGIAEKTSLLEAMKSFFGCPDPRTMINFFYKDPCEAPSIAPFSEAVSIQAEKGDRVARSILLKAAKFLAGYTFSLIDRLKEINPDYKCNTAGIYGSVITGDNKIRRHYEKLLKARYPEIMISPPPIRPEEAAYLYAKTMMENKDDKNE